MNPTVYEKWWQLHVRVAKGEELDAAERAIYKAGMMELDAEEESQWEKSDLAMLRKLKAEVENLETTHAQLQARSHRLDRQIWTLEGAYMVLTGFELRGRDYAPLPI
jgi:predicted RNase H-like nuclease (RuvC/YqgF family)